MEREEARSLLNDEVVTVDERVRHELLERAPVLGKHRRELVRPLLKGRPLEKLPGVELIASGQVPAGSPVIAAFLTPIKSLRTIQVGDIESLPDEWPS